MSITAISAIDLFCGAGGLTNGLQSAGVSVVAGIDVDPNCEYAYEYNNGARFKQKDVAKLSGADLNAMFPEGALRLLAGCAPCQPFSRYTQGKDATTHPKWGLLDEFQRLIKEAKPDFVTMENVASLTKFKVFDHFCNKLEKLGYKVDWRVLKCAQYGLPQTRERLVLVASLHGEIKLPTPPLNYKTVEESIGHLPPIAAGTAYKPDPLHAAATLSPVNLKRIKASVPNGTWRDWPKSLRADCHKKPSGKSYPSVYGRMAWDSQAPTMTTLCYGFGNGRFGHPDQDRAISLREAAILQSFPDDYRFAKPDEPILFKSVGRMIGNAVPPLIGLLVGQSIRASLAKKAPKIQPGV